MANSTAAYWDINGTSLNQFGWSVKSIGSGVALPTLVGDDIAVANRPGVSHQEKIPGPRTVSLGMWTTGTIPATGIRSGALSSAMLWNQNWDTLRKLVFRENGAQLTLTRRWYTVSGGVASLTVASAFAEHVGTLEPGMTSRDRCDFVMEFLLADPYFYSTTTTSTTWSGSGSKTITNIGDVSAWHANNFTISFTGPWTTPTMTNSTYYPDVWFKYDSSIAAGETVLINVGDFTALSSVRGNVTGLMTHGGDRPWMRLAPGVNVVSLSGGGGTCTLNFKAPYL